MTWRQMSWCAAAAILAVSPALAAPQAPPAPGAVNYIEGQASVNGQPVDSKSIGSVFVGPGGTLSTGAGKAEMLLTPGVFLRLGENSELHMVSSGLADTRVALTKGQATVEADYFSKDNHLTVDQGMASTMILKNGLYVLSPNQPFVKVLDGEAKVTVGDRHVNAGKGEAAILNSSGKLKTDGFNAKLERDDALVRWSRLRSSYEAEANYNEARTVYPNNGWYGPGWYWDAGFGFWSFLPGDGYLYSPFGWGFYSPAFLYGYGYPLYGRPGFYGRAGFAGPRYYGGFRGGFAGAGFAARGGGFGGGGFHR